MRVLDYKYIGQLVRKAQGGDSNAFAELYVATYQQQFRYAYRYLKDEELAQDALQETFVQALKNIRKLQNPDLFIAWLNRINFRTCYDIKKAQHVDKQDDFSEINLAKLKSTEGRPEDEVVEIDTKNYIMRQVLNLPLTESQAILMKYYQELTNDEIAEILNVSRSTVKRYLKSGRERLARMLSEIRT